MVVDSPKVQTGSKKFRSVSPGAQVGDDDDDIMMSFKKSPRLSPSSSPGVLSPSAVPSGANNDPPLLTLPPSIVESVGKKAQQVPVPSKPPVVDKTKIIGSTTTIASDEAYSADEEMLNDFLYLHPMLRCVVPLRAVVPLLTFLLRAAWRRRPRAPFSS